MQTIMHGCDDTIYEDVSFSSMSLSKDHYFLNSISHIKKPPFSSWTVVIKREDLRILSYAIILSFFLVHYTFLK